MPVVIAHSLEHALHALASEPFATPLAGGTDLMVGVNFGRATPTSVVAIDRLAELRGWQVEGHSVRIGAGTTYADLESAEMAALVPALAQAARTVGSPQIRNAGTIGGNVATASPAGDTLPALAALDATIELRTATDTRVVPWADFFVGPKRTALQPGELITAVHVPRFGDRHEFLKVGTRNAMVIAVASLCLTVDAGAQRLHCALGSVGPVPIRASAAEAWAQSELDWPRLAARRQPADLPEVAAEFGRQVAAAARPIDDHRGSAAYRRHAIAVCAARALKRAWREVI